MIIFKYPEEKMYFQRFSQELSNPLALSLLSGSDIANAEQATTLSLLFWAIVAKSIAAEKCNELDDFPEGAEFWNEKLMNSISGYLERMGFDQQWDEVVDSQ